MCDTPRVLTELSADEFNELLSAYFAPAEKRHQMTQEEITALASKLAAKHNIPLANEQREEKIFYKVILKVDTFLYDNLPNEIYDLVRSTDKGIDEAEATRLIHRLSQLANDKIDIPYVPEWVEYYAIKFVIGVVINAARKDWDFNKAKDASEAELMLT